MSLFEMVSDCGQ